MNISEGFIKRPIATSLLMAAIALFGLVAYRSLPVSDLPNVDFPTLLVSAQLRKLDGVDANVCTYLARWRDTGWSTDYERKLRDPFYEIFGLDHAVVGRAARRAANTIPALQRLGLTFDHALKLASVDSILGF